MFTSRYVNNARHGSMPLPSNYRLAHGLPEAMERVHFLPPETQAGDELHVTGRFTRCACIAGCLTVFVRPLNPNVGGDLAADFISQT